jgi:hypothetical protein
MHRIPRSHFIKSVIAGAIGCPYVCLRATELDDLRGDKVGWARLKTPSQWWKRHSETDASLMRFLKEQTSLNLDSVWRVADVEHLDEMCEFPLLFSQGIDTVQTETGRSNIAEYIGRGGFLLIDACIDDRVTPDPDVFLQRQKETLTQAIPESRVLNIPEDDELYRCYFRITGRRPPETHTFYYKRDDPRWTQHGLYEIRLGSRMAGIITLAGLQCGWARVGRPPPEGHDIECMKMLVNIYVHAMAQGG